MRGLPEELEVGEGTALRLDGVVERGVRPVGVRFGELEGSVESGVVGEEVLWWCVLEVPADAPEGKRELVLMLEGTDGGKETRLLGETVVSSRIAPAIRGQNATKRAIAVCMATFEPKREWLVGQLDSIRGQTRSDWVCLISDDCSSEEGFAVLRRAVGDDPRFVVSRSERNLGFYANFERAIRMAPGDAELIALCDQDDRWEPDKLEALAATLDANPDALLAYSDMRVVDEAGTVLSDTYWYARRNRCDDVASILIANTVTGAASMFRRELLEAALPFPPGGTPEHYHDQWLALCALGLGEIAYLDRSTYDYTRHSDSVTVAAAAEWYSPPRGTLARARLRVRRLGRRLRKASRGPVWRELYLERILLFRQLVTVLELRAGDRIDPRKRRALELVARTEGSPRSITWLAGRVLRPLAGRTETLAQERVLIGALAWRSIVARRARV